MGGMDHFVRDTADHMALVVVKELTRSVCLSVYACVYSAGCPRYES